MKIVSVNYRTLVVLVVGRFCATGRGKVGYFNMFPFFFFAKLCLPAGSTFISIIVIFIYEVLFKEHFTKCFTAVKQYRQVKVLKSKQKITGNS